MDSIDLNTKVALITGGGRGIGAGVARKFAKEGLKVAVAARSEEQVREVADEIDGLAVHMDVTDAASIDQAVATVREKLGPIAIVVNNAGITDSAPVVKTPEEQWRKIIDVNLTGTFLVTKACLPDMIDAKWGRVINVASNTGLYGRPYIGAYTASKHGVIGLTRTLAQEVARKGITANAVCPGFVDTDIVKGAVDAISSSTGRSTEDALKALEELSPQKRVYTVEEVAHLCFALIPHEARGINGAALVLDGGQICH
jgi:NAD(P)-dependent dehydrogenase (short-subunit alcohol dehydrogenase family)